METSLFTRSVERVMSSKHLGNLGRSLAFRLTILYAGLFAVSLFAALIAFYMIPLHTNPDVSHHGLSELREEFRHYFGIPLMVLIALSAGAGWFMAKRALSGVEEVTRAAVDITNGALDRRVPVKQNRDEIDRLAASFNTMVDRVQDLIGQMREITENIAHDLRSPITRMRGMAEMTLTGHDDDEEQAALAGTIIEECDRLLGLINAMLDISEAESGLAKFDAKPVDIALLLRDVCDLFQPLAENRDIAVTVEIPESIMVPGDPRRLQRVFSNLIDNALKYTPTGGSVRISAQMMGHHVEVVIADSGQGIKEEDLPHIFDRFFRGERSRSTPGNGLGLSLARAFVLIHGGAIKATSAYGEGSQFTVMLPQNPLPHPENGLPTHALLFPE